MKLFQCGRCANLLYFENSRCTNCGSGLGFASDVMDLLAIEPKGSNTWEAVAVAVFTGFAAIISTRAPATG